MYVDFIRKSRGQVLQIPRTALAESLKDPYVYVVESGKAQTRKISVGRDLGDYLEVISGLLTRRTGCNQRTDQPV